MKTRLPKEQQEEFLTISIIVASLVILGFRDNLAAAIIGAGVLVLITYLVMANLKNLPDVISFSFFEEKKKEEHSGTISSNNVRGGTGRLLDVRLGVDSGRGSPAIINLGSATHIGVYAQSGTGKTVLAQLLLWRIVSAYPSKRVKVALLDPKVYSYSIYSNVEHLLFGLARGEDACLAGLRKLKDELERRERAFASLPQDRLVEDLYSYHRVAYEERMDVQPIPWLIVVIDEVQELASMKEAMSILTSLAKKGRALGIRLILITQRPTTAGLPHEIQSQLETKLVGPMDSRQEYAVARVPREIYENMVHRPGAFALRYRGEWSHIQADRLEPADLEEGMRRITSGREAPPSLIVNGTGARPVVGVGLSSVEKRERVVAWMVAKGSLEKPLVAEVTTEFGVSEATAARYIKSYWPDALGRILAAEGVDANVSSV